MTTGSDELPVERAPRRRGCLFWGCLSVVVVFLVLGGFVGYGAYKLRQYTSTKAVPVPKYDLKRGEREDLDKRVAAFVESSKAGKAHLELTASDLNGLVFSSSVGSRLAGKIFTRIEGDKLRVDLCLPLTGIPLFSDRYVNGIVTVRPEKKGDEFVLIAEEVTINEESLPESYVQALRDENLLARFSTPELLDFAKRVESLSVKDGKLAIEAKDASKPEKAPAEEE